MNISMKRMIAGAILALPFAVAALPTQQASASEIIANPHFHTQTSRPTLVARRHRVWVPGHWERTRHGRRWVAGHYEYR